jgi:hypothetical protein
MNHIALYLERFKELHKDFNNAKFLLQRTIKDSTGIEFPIEQLTEKNGVVRIDCDPIERSVMLERREQLEAALKTNLKLNRVQVR